MILQKILLLKTILADRILQSQWLNTYACEGPPNAMYIFNINDIEAYEPDEDETWAPLYTDFAGEYIIGQCGYKYTPIYAGCCFASLDLKISEGWMSGSPALLDPDDDAYESLVHLGANDNTYCSVKPINGSLFTGLVEVLVLADDTTCVDQYYKCKKNGDFLVYADDGCSGDPISVKLLPQSTEYDDPDLGLLTGKMVTFQKGSVKNIWTLFTPDFKNLAFVPSTGPFVIYDVIRVSLLFIQLIFYGLGVIHGIMKLRKGYKLYIVAQIASQLLYFAFVCTYVYQDMGQTGSNATLYTLSFVGNWFYGLATLGNAYLTVLLLYSVKLSFIPRWSIYPVCVLLLLLHVFLAGSVYINVCSIPGLKKWSYCTSGLRKVWRTFNPYWIITMFLWNLVPTTLLIFYMVRLNLDNKGIPNTLKTLWGYDRPVFAILLIQIAIIVAYQNVYKAIDYNDYLNNDKIAIGIQALKGVLRSLHSLFNIFYLDRVPKIFKQSSSSVSNMNKSAPANSAATKSSVKTH